MAGSKVQTRAITLTPGSPDEPIRQVLAIRSKIGYACTILEDNCPTYAFKTGRMGLLSLVRYLIEVLKPTADERAFIEKGYMQKEGQ
jgi:hypothetical protein